MTDYPAECSSFIDGYFPRLQTCDGCNKLATDNVHVDLLLQARQEMVIDMDLGAQQLKLSMMTPMVVGTRYQFVTKTPVNFGPHNRKSNIFRLGARGKTPVSGSMESGDGGMLVKYLEGFGKGIQALDDMGRAELEHIYSLCFKGKRGLDR